MKLLIILLSLMSFPIHAVEIGEKAPLFSLQGLEKEVSLSDFQGKIIILEWLNHGCPFVRKHYDSGNMQRLQKTYTQKDVVWLSIISSAPGKQGHVDQAEAKKDKKQNESLATDILLDPKGQVGRLYGAKTTPHMYVINQEGTLVYQGAIDDKPDTKAASIPDSKNYVALALDEVLAKRKVTQSKTQAYGCSVKY